MKYIVCFLFAILSCTAAPGAASAEETRLALLIGNEDYPSEVGRLSLPHQDVATLSGALRSVGFEVTARQDLDEDGMDGALSAFEQKIASAAARGETVIAFLYYSGHGASALIDGERTNYLLPATERITTVSELARKGIPLDEVVLGLSQTNASAVFVVTDACRNDLVRAFDRSGNKGFTPPSTRPGMFIAHSTYPGAVAPDDGAFAQTLARYISKPGIEAARAFTLTNREVAQGRGGNLLIPTVANALSADFFFAGREAAPPPSPAVILADDEGTALAQAITAGTLDAYTAFKRRFPRHERIAFVDAEIRRLTPRPVEPVSSARSPGSVFRDRLSGGGQGPEMVVVPAGSFMMGSPESEQGRFNNEGPQRRVTISKPFAVGKFEVTVGQFRTFVNDSGYDVGDRCRTFEGGGWDWRDGINWQNPGFSQSERSPVTCVSWEDVQAYMKWLSRKTGEDYGLLSEAQWEYAARAGSMSRFSWGEGEPTCTKSLDNTANFGSCSGDREELVGYSSANAFGLYDMHGNVWEWIEDCWHENYDGAPTDGSVWTANCSSNNQVIRGGSWRMNPQLLRSAFRFKDTPDIRVNSLGFRVTRDLSE